MILGCKLWAAANSYGAGHWGVDEVLVRKVKTGRAGPRLKQLLQLIIVGTGYWRSTTGASKPKRHWFCDGWRKLAEDREAKRRLECHQGKIVSHLNRCGDFGCLVSFGVVTGISVARSPALESLACKE
jgi:hypothetical protein